MSWRSRAVCLMLLVMGSAEVTSALGYRHMDLDTLVRASDLIVYGKVIRIRPQYDSATGSIWTHTEILVIDTAKGPSKTSLTVTEPGGVIGGRGELFPGVPRFGINQEVVLFLYLAPGNRLRITGLQQGVFTVAADLKTGERIALPSTPPAEVVYESGSRLLRAARSSTSGAEKLSHFMNTLRQKASVR